MTEDAVAGLEGRTALVTGAGRMNSIGRSIALALATAGADLLLVGTAAGSGPRTDQERAAGWCGVDSVADEVRALGRSADAIAADIGDESAVSELRGWAQGRGGVDILVNNAGASRGADRAPVTDLEASEWDRVFATNVRGVFLMCRAFGGAMRDAGRPGSIINIASIAAKTARANSAAYASSKAAVLALTASMAKEVAPAGIRVNVLCPGLIETSRTATISDEFRAGVLAQIPLGRAGSPMDVAAATVFLASDGAAWVTGQAWNIDGGQVMY